MPGETTGPADRNPDWPALVRSCHFSEVISDRGLVTAPDPLVSEAGAEMLRAGGNAVDAVVAAAFADGVVEPCMSGMGGGATMTVAMKETGEIVAIEGHMVAPSAASSDQYPLALGVLRPQPVVPRERPRDAWSVAFFDFPEVEGNVNLFGAKAVATPGAVACLLKAHEIFGKLPRQQVLGPAIGMAGDGIRVNWLMAACVASEARLLARDPGCAQVFLPKGLPLRGPMVAPGAQLAQPKLARALEVLAERGAEAFYGGEIGRSVVDTVAGGGGLLSIEDLARYEATVSRPRAVPFGPIELVSAAVSGLPTVAECLYLYEEAVRTATEARGNLPLDDAVAWAVALKLSFEDRFRWMTGDRSLAVPWEAFYSRDYAAARLAADRYNRPSPDPFAYTIGGGSRDAAPVRPQEHGHTSQISAVDREGNMVSLTATILAEFGARLLDPATGIVLNNGMAYFDPRPGSANSVKPGVPVLSAMTPTILTRGDRGPFCAFGASGGLRIISGVAQIAAAVAAGGTLQEAVEKPRIHAESSTVMLDVRWPSSAAEELAQGGFEVVPVVEEPSTVHFARPNGVIVGNDGLRRSGVDPMKPGGASVG